MSSVLTSMKDKYVALRGFHTDRKLLVIESDDWGSIRMPSRKTFDHLLSAGDNPQKDAFLSNDCLESESDLLALFDVLRSVKDIKGNHAAITANFATANPKFEDIDYCKGIYKYEPFYETYDRYYGENKILEIVKEGIRSHCFVPQLHCREHMNVGRWMKHLQEKKADTLLAFENKMIGVGASFSPSNPFGYMDSFHTDCASDTELSEILADANVIFRKSFGFQSQSFVASCFVWNQELEKNLHRQGIRFIQAAIWQNAPVVTNGEGGYRRKIHFTGETNKNGQIYSVRNCSYEPAGCENLEEVTDTCFAQIRKSFACRKPAIISSHRHNFIGSIHPENRTRNLAGLKKLLDRILEAYPDVEFITSPQLFEIMERKQNERAFPK